MTNEAVPWADSGSPCAEQHVLEADVIRTRGDIEDFHGELHRSALTIIMQTFCLQHCTQYKQGMNEVCQSMLF
jgi:hypothetical protein